jgi:glycosyltransferase involved in cell wall biosynthesis
MPHFSVIIPVYNRPESLICAVESVVKQTCSDYELIIVDDGSEPAAFEVQKLYGGRIRYIRQENKGVSSARNLGIRVSSGEYLLFLDSDDMWLPGKIQAHKEFISSNPRIKIHQTREIWFRRGTRVNPGKKHIQPQGYIFEQSLELCLISPSACAVSREIFNRYGLFDENMPACEDYDLWLRTTPFEECGLIDKQLSVRFGGHGDQLSSAYEAMDRMRLYSIINLLVNCGNILTDSQINAAETSGIKRCGILIKGCAGRGLENNISKYEEIRDNLINKRYSSRAVQIPAETACFLTGRHP